MGHCISTGEWQSPINHPCLVFAALQDFSWSECVHGRSLTEPMLLIQNLASGCSVWLVTVVRHNRCDLQVQCSPHAETDGCMTGFSGGSQLWPAKLICVVCPNNPRQHIIRFQRLKTPCCILLRLSCVLASSCSLDTQQVRWSWKCVASCCDLVQSLHTYICIYTLKGFYQAPFQCKEESSTNFCFGCETIKWNLIKHIPQSIFNSTTHTNSNHYNQSRPPELCAQSVKGSVSFTVLLTNNYIESDESQAGRSGLWKKQRPRAVSNRRVLSFVLTQVQFICTQNPPEGRISLCYLFYTTCSLYYWSRVHAEYRLLFIIIKPSMDGA